MTSVLWGAILVVITEVLSFGSVLTRPLVAGSWAAVLVLLLRLGFQREIFRPAFVKFRPPHLQLSLMEWSTVVGMGMVVLALAIVAWLSPPNTTDSLLYHMSRVAHWIQNGNLGHYPTAYLTQLWASPFAEMVILNFQLLFGSDQPVNMIQWFSMLGSLVGVTAIARLLGADRRGQLLSAAFAISIPMGILQATSTQTDYVTAFWLICLMYFVLQSKQRPSTPAERLAIGLATGLGVLTKGTFYPLAIPILIWHFLPLIRDTGFRQAFRVGISTAVVVLILNMGFWVRNMNSFGGPLGPSNAIDQHTELSLAPGKMISTLLRHIALNFATPWEGVNESIVSSINSFQELVGADHEDFELIWGWNQEDFAGNPIHFTTLAMAVLVFPAIRRRVDANKLQKYLWIWLATFLLFGVLVQASQFSVRLQLPLLVLGAPAIGTSLSRIKNRILFGVLLVGLVIVSLPWVLFNSGRPIIAMRQGPEPWAIPCTFGCTRTGSVFFRSQQDLMFANWLDLQEPVRKISQEIRDSGCERVGLRIDSRDMEYLFWWSLDAPRDGLRIESIATLPVLERYLDPTFEPCAVICTTCGFRTEAFGMELRYNRQYLSLFMGEGYTKEIDP